MIKNYSSILRIKLDKEDEKVVSGAVESRGILGKGDRTAGGGE